ncbi:molybdopterin cofactor-binding domain-containing protein [Spirillospora sp. NPDC048819]|uniref:molybdopterin cofactor-binding domain-containing protein n=1 Tax=Spirillospora sp. NPDC048819 TaxID=3155268 RepID=UPI0033E59B51
MTSPRAPRVVGTNVPAKNWDERTSGTDAYAGDLEPPGTLTAWVLRSPHPYARILSVDTGRARRMPGVHAVITAADLPADAAYIHAEGPYSDRRPLARGVVRYVGEEVAAVAAETPEQARAAAEAIVVRYRRPRRWPPLTIDAASARRAIRLHRRSSGEPNVSVHDKGHWGDPEAGRAASTVSVEGTFHYPRVSHACMEPNTTLAHWHADTGVLELWTSTQAPWFITTEVAHVLGLDPEQVVCRDVAVGGGFGSKSKVSEHEALASALSMAAGRPVRLAYSREEEFGATKPRHAFRVRLRSSADDTGRLRALDARLDVDNGAYNHYGPSIMKVGVKTLGSIYRPDGVSWDARLIDTALPPGGQFRGYGSPQVAFAMESQVDELAERLGIDPIDLRMRNANEPGTTTMSGARLGSARLAECLAAVRDAIGWDDKRRDRRPLRGVGVACGMHGSGSYAHGGSNRSDAIVDLFEDGRVRVRFGGADAGTGQRTVLAQIAAEELGVHVDDVDVLMADGELTPFDMGAWSSRGTHMGGHAVRKAAAELAETVRGLAAEKLGTDDIRLDGGRAHAPDADIGLSDLVALCPDARDGMLSNEASYVDPRMETFGGGNPRPNVSASYTFAAHAVEVEVDPATGRVRVLDYVAAHDIGRAINPVMAEGQVIGGVAQGLGAALGEELIYESGRPVNPAYINYALPRAADLPPVRVVLIEGDEEAGPYDAKSVGEMPIVPPAPAVANAVYDAIGVRIRDLPITPDKVLRALAERDGLPARRHRLAARPSRWWIELLRRAYPLGVHWTLHRFGTRLARRAPEREIESVRRPSDAGEAVKLTASGGTAVGGNTDLALQRRQGLSAPRTLVQITGIPALRTIIERDDGALDIGAAVTLDALAAATRGSLDAVADAVASIASAQIRAVATVGGNLVQAKRCWFFRNGFDCYKRGGVTCPCYAVQGDHRFYHAAIGGHRCQAVTPSDLGTVFTALDARVMVSGPAGDRTVAIGDFYTGPGETCLRPGELVTAVRVPASARERRCVFDKLQLWEGDFAVVSIALSAAVTAGRWKDTRVVLGAVAPTPWRARATETACDGARFDAGRFRGHLDGELSRHGHPLPGNAWKLDAALGMAVRAAGRMGGDP